MTSGVISFDLDGTLIAGPFGRVLNDLHDELAASGVQGTKPEIQRRHQQLLSSDPYAAYDWETIVGGYLREVGQDLPFSLLERLDDHIRSGATRLLHDGTIGLLGDLRAAGWQVVLLTNGWRWIQEPILDQIGLLAAVDRLLTGDDVVEPKPSPHAFAAARGDATRYVHVGDRIDHDVVGANAVGAQTVLLRPDVPCHGPVSSSNPQLLDYLREVAAQQQSVIEDEVLMVPTYLAAELAEVRDWLAAPEVAPLPH